jgi:hypothetical protein
MQGRLAAAAACFAIALTAGVGGRAESADAQIDLSWLGETVAPSAGAAYTPMYSRVISARVRHERLRPTRRSNARRIGRALASMRPTWVTGTLRYRRNQYPKRNEVRAWKEIRRIVHHQSPTAQFDVVLNADQYRTPAAIERTMRRLRTKLGPEGWFFDFLSRGARRYPKAVKAAIDNAHAHGEWIGGNIFGFVKRSRGLPLRVDFWSVQDFRGFHLNLPAVRRLAAKRPILYHLESNPHRPRSGGCRFILGLNDGQRKRLIRRRAAQQDKYGFRFSYPAIYPQCLRERPRGPGTYLYAFNAFRNPPVRREIERQLDRNDFDPRT